MALFTFPKLTFLVLGVSIVPAVAVGGSARSRDIRTNGCGAIAISNIAIVFARASPAPPSQRRPPRRLVTGIAARLTAKLSRPEMAPQRLEKIESAPGNGRASEASNPQDVVHGRAAESARPPTTKPEKNLELTQPYPAFEISITQWT